MNNNEEPYCVHNEPPIYEPHLTNVVPPKAPNGTLSKTEEELRAELEALKLEMAALKDARHIISEEVICFLEALKKRVGQYYSEELKRNLMPDQACKIHNDHAIGDRAIDNVTALVSFFNNRDMIEKIENSKTNTTGR